MNKYILRQVIPVPKVIADSEYNRAVKFNHILLQMISHFIDKCCGIREYSGSNDTERRLDYYRLIVLTRKLVDDDPEINACGYKVDILIDQFMNDIDVDLYKSVEKGEEVRLPLPRIISHRDGIGNPSEMKCVCGEYLYLDDPLDNFCECRKCYNSSAQTVVPSSQCDEQGNPYDFD